MAIHHKMHKAAADTWAGLDERPFHLMGIVNVTPDSFSDGGQHATTEAAITHALQLERDGATILDIGGESTRPGSDPVEEADEYDRVIPVIEALATKVRPDTRISVDTRKAAIMRAAIKAGAHIVNDVSALTHDPEALVTVADLDAPVVLMHAQGDPKTMQDAPHYDDVVAEIVTFLSARVTACERAGLRADQLCIDPGIGFGKTLAHNLTLLANLDRFVQTGAAVLLGASRKRFIGTLSGEPNANARAPGSIAAAIRGFSAGIRLFRVHDVAETHQALTVWHAMSQGGDEDSE